MQNIINVNFNFELLEDVIVQELHKYNICKENYFQGSETIDDLKKQASILFESIDFCDACIMFRKKIINKQYLEKREGECEQIRKDRLIDENKYLLTRLNWHRNLKTSIEKECKKFAAGEFGIDEEHNC